MDRVIAQDDCDTPAIRRNLKRTRQVWGRLSKVTTTEGVTPRVAGMFHHALVATTWCLTESACCLLDGFHVEAAHRITGMQPGKVKQQGKEKWIYLHTAKVLSAAGLPSNNWWQQVLDYSGKEEGDQTGTMGGLDNSASFVRLSSIPLLPSAHCAPAPTRRPRSPVELLTRPSRRPWTLFEWRLTPMIKGGIGTGAYMLVYYWPRARDLCLPVGA